ncbi:unnamed protein product [Rhizoctonia solani]|uniref:Laminin domain protein n=1 Tax=Rhizoctonia solani TaxID=456999 RepID=A0A8H3AR93_9AGAM|nr:unnamed protein product [Rhizoctonia solani]
MTNYPPNQICSPPELPAYLKTVCDLKPIVGVPKDEEMVGIHAVLRMAHKFVDDMCDSRLFVRLSGHLFDTQMAKYRSQYPCSIFDTNTTYTPPILPTYVASTLEPVPGAPSDEQIAKVQGAIWSYQKYADIPTMFDPQLHASLSQHLFDIQMERYIRHGSSQVGSGLHKTSKVEPRNLPPTTEQEDGQIDSETNNTGTGADIAESHRCSQVAGDAGAYRVMERSNQLAEQTNQLLERSNLLIERSNQIAERANHLVEQSKVPVDRPGEPVSQLTHTLIRSSNQHNEKPQDPQGIDADILGESATPKSFFQVSFVYACVITKRAC